MDKIYEEIVSYIRDYIREDGVSITSLREKDLIAGVMEQLIIDPAVQNTIAHLSSKAVSDYTSNLKKITVTFTVDEKKLKDKWHKEMPNMSLVDIVGEELSWAVPTEIVIDKVEEEVDHLYKAIYIELEQTALSLGLSLADDQLDSLTQDFIAEDSIWQDIHEFMADTIQLEIND